MTTSSLETRELARRLKSVETQVRGLAAGPQLAYSSIEDGGINEYDIDGTLKSTTGKQYDGTSTSASFNGPPPPVPTAPILVPVAGGLTISWDGMFADGPTTVAPMDFSRVEIHAAGAAFTPLLTPHLLATFETPRGATVLISLAPVVQFVSLVAVSLSGKFSLASVQVSAIPLQLVDQAAIDAQLAPLLGLPAQMAANTVAVDGALADVAALNTVATGAASTADAAALAAADAHNAAVAASDAAAAAVITAAADATAKANTAQTAATSAAATTAQAAADAAQAAAIAAAAITAQAKADAAQVAAIAAADIYADAQASGASAGAIAAAATDAQAKADAAQAAAIAAAATTAQAKADAAQAAATSAAAITAQAKADSAQAAAIAAAASDATTKANTAKTDAIAAAATTAQAKADAAQAAAIAAAATTAQAKADAAAATAKADAIAAAAADATAKANGAQTAATTAAATTAQAKADAAQAAAITAAATTAQAKADAAQAAAIAAAAITAQAKADAAQTAAIAAAATDATTKANAAIATAAADATAKANVALAASNGKNKIIFSTADAPTTGLESYVAGDTWFKKTGAIIVGQWEFVGGAFVARTIGNEVIANLDAAKITTGYLLAARIDTDTIVARMIKGGEIIAGKLATDSVVATNIKGGEVIAGKLAVDSVIAGNIAALAVTANTIAANAVTADKISATALYGKVIVGATIRTAETGPRFEVDSFGARLYDETGNLDVNLPTDPTQSASFVGDISATGLTVQDHFSLQGVNNELAAQSVTTLQSGLMPPASAPSVALGWPEVEISTTNDDRVNFYFGLWATPGGGGFSRGWVHYDYNLYGDITHFQVERFNTAGVLLSTTPMLGSAGDDVVGAAEVGTNIIALVSLSGGVYSLKSYNSTSGSGGSVESFSIPAGGFKPAVFADGAWVYLAYLTDTQVIIQRRDPSTLAVSAIYMGANGGLKQNLTTGLGFSSFDYGGAYRFILTTSLRGAYAYSFLLSGTTLSLQMSDSWPYPKSEIPYGVAWDGLRFWSGPRDRSNIMVKLSRINWTTESAVWWAQYAWYQTSSGYQTKVSPIAKFTMIKRAWITFSAPFFPIAASQPNAIMNYLGRGAADPGAGGMWHPSADVPVAGARTRIYDENSFSGSQPIAVGTFPAAVAGLLASSAKRSNQAPRWSLSGDGTALFQDMEVSGYLRNQPTTQRGSVSLAATVATTGALSGSIVFAVPMVSPPTVTMTAATSRLTCSTSGMTINGFNWSVNNWSPGGAGATTAGWIAQC